MIGPLPYSSGELGLADRDDDALAQIVAEVGERVEQGELVNQETYLLRYPECAERLRSLWRVLVAAAQLRPSESPLTSSLDSPSAKTDDSSDTDNDRLGDFRLIRELGRGGMGIVYEAEQTSLRRRVALKVLTAAGSIDDRQLQRFQIEARAAAVLHHANIVPVFSVGTERRVPFYAMQFIEGISLAAVIGEMRQLDGLDQNGPRAACALTRTLRAGRFDPRPDDRLPADFVSVRSKISRSRPARVSGWSRSRGSSFYRTVAALGVQAARALEHAHQHGILHRDIKPSNLLIDESGHLWVTDFGLARVQGETALTQTGDMLGTLRYMSPESAAGGAKRAFLDGRTDIYSLGVTLYELLTLRPAFFGDDRVEVLRKIAQDEPTPPRKLDRTVPIDLETIVLKALAKEPADRYPSAGDLAGDLEDFLDGRPIHARRPSPGERTVRWARRHRVVATAAAVVLLIVLTGLGAAAIWRDEVLRRHNSELRTALDLAEQNELSTRRLWHDSQMRLAQQAWTSGQVELAQEILGALRPSSPDRDLRGFEWHYLHRICHRDVSMLTDHDSRSMTVSPDGQTLISGDRYGSIIFLDVGTGIERIRIQAHGRDVVGLMISPDGGILASWSNTVGLPSEVKLWDARRALHLTTVPEMEGYAETLAFARDSRTLMILERRWNPDSADSRVAFWNVDPVSGHIKPDRASIAADRMACSRDGRLLAIGMDCGTTVTLRDASSSALKRTLSRRLPGIGGIDFSPDGNIVAAHSPGVTIWDTRSGRELGSLPFLSWFDHAFSPDGQALAGITSARDAIELIKDVTTNPRLLPLEAASGTNLHMAFSLDGKMLAGGGSGRPAALWSTSSGRKLAEFPDETGVVGPLVFAPGGESLIFGGEDGRIHSWHFVKNPESFTELAAHSAEVWGLAYIPDGALLISSADDGLIKIWDARNGELRSTLTGHESLVAAVTVSNDGSLLASAGFDSTVRLWDLASGRPRTVFRGHTDRVRAVAFSPDGRHLASAGSDMTVRIWDIDSREPIVVYRGHTDTVRALAFDPAGGLVVSASDDRTIRGIDGKSGVERFSLPCANHNSAVAFSPDGSLLASADDRGTVTIWEVATWKRRHSAKGSDVGIWGLSFSPNGKTLAAACGDAKVRLWDPIAGQVTLVLDGHAERVNAVAFAPDGATLASASHDGAVRLWRASQP